ncbi:MAG: PepSY domain-containing protein [Chloroflexota bacterium]|nr:PepSY domain-containing protein [Chloroflexota bacterium]MBI5703752.1 PepSY domain-containing protein [Chloroflexota bacterium]
MKRLRPTISIALAFAMLFAAVLSCNIGKREERANLYSLYYTIEPTSLLESLQRGEAAFTPVSQRPELIPVDQKVTVNWHQADYFYVANALYEGVLGKTLQGWQLSGMGFSLGCSDVQNGFQNGRFGFFSVVADNDQESRLERSINIDPSNNFIHVSETKYSPNLIDLKIIDLTQIKISADQALQIAESNGGEEKRASVKNACGISLLLTLYRTGKLHWRVYYARSDDRTLFFDILIDPYTGEVRFP